MGCTNCNTCEVSEKRGCGTSSVFDWLYQIPNASNNKANDYVEVQFKADRKEYYINSEKLNINKGDWVAVQSSSGHDIGKVTLTGDLVALQLTRKKINTQKEPLKKIYRIATEKDISKWKIAIAKEEETLHKAKKIIKNHKLEMKLSSVEFQADETKASFYYTSESRVDFRELIKELYREFNVRVEMKQIGVRQEASKIGGIGSCGRELCCSTWMTSFPSVSTAAVRYQQLAINPQKISGQCGRLKCCLNFELDAYTDALKDFPNTKTLLNTKKGKAKYFKMDVFKRKMWYFYTNEFFNPIPLSLSNVNQIIDLNKKGEFPENIEDFMQEQINSSKTFINAAGEDSINRFDKPKNHKRRKKSKKGSYKKQKQ